MDTIHSFKCEHIITSLNLMLLKVSTIIFFEVHAEKSTLNAVTHLILVCTNIAVMALSKFIEF